jgi:hypothetical protein
MSFYLCQQLHTCWQTYIVKVIAAFFTRFPNRATKCEQVGSSMAYSHTAQPCVHFQVSLYEICGRKKWQKYRFLYTYLGFPMPMSFHQCSTGIHSSIAETIKTQQFKPSFNNPVHFTSWLQNTPLAFVFISGSNLCLWIWIFCEIQFREVVFRRLICWIYFINLELET